MGVTILQAYPVPQDKTAPQVIDFLTKRITNLGANSSGQFIVDCETYYSTPALNTPSKTLNVLHNTEHPATVFSIVESSGTNKQVVFTSDILFGLLLPRFANVYQRKGKIESKGSRFEIGDFIVKLGLVSISGSFKGILVEIEYLPCVVLQSCWGLICEFMQGFLGSAVTTQVPSTLKGKAAEIFTPVDTIVQYLDHFTSYRKNTAAAGLAQQPARPAQVQAQQPAQPPLQQ